MARLMARTPVGQGMCEGEPADRTWTLVSLRTEVLFGTYPAAGGAGVVVVAGATGVVVVAGAAGVVAGAAPPPESWQKRLPTSVPGTASMSRATLFRSTMSPNRSRWSGPRTRLR